MTFPARPPCERGALHGRPVAFGRSVLGAPLELWPSERGDAKLLVVAGVHGEEGEGVVLLSAALRSLASGVRSADVVLALNPDGLARGTRGNANGVDLNRNFPCATWSAEPTAYRWTLEEDREVVLSPGAAPASEPETRAFLDLCAERAPTQILSIHAPLGCVDDPASTPLGLHLAKATGLDHVGDVGYPTPGSMGTWGAEQGVSIVTWELPRRATEEHVRAYGSLLARILTEVDA